MPVPVPRGGIKRVLWATGSSAAAAAIPGGAPTPYTALTFSSSGGRVLCSCSPHACAQLCSSFQTRGVAEASAPAEAYAG